MVYNPEDRVREDLGAEALGSQAGRASTRCEESIAAIATPPGHGGIGIIRVSGPAVKRVAYWVLGEEPEPRTARVYEFLDQNKSPIDQGLAIFFNNPHSYTGEDVLELHGHGSPAALDMLMTRILELGTVRLARPGEFTERAFLNGKLDLAQAESVADLIGSRTHAAARAAKKSLEGAFSKEITSFSKNLRELRVQIEAEIDFSDEPVGVLDDDKLRAGLDEAAEALESLLCRAKRGALLGGGAKVVLAGPANAGKSSLMNALLAEERSIVHNSPGTTRDVIESEIDIDGLLLRLTDTAGLRQSNDEVETEGVRRAGNAIRGADLVLLVLDDTNDGTNYHEWLKGVPSRKSTIVILNKCDITNRPYGVIPDFFGEVTVATSATKQLGLNSLLEAIKQQLGYSIMSNEEPFMARHRHLRALESAKVNLAHAAANAKDRRGIELVAEDVRIAQQALAEILGTVSNEELLGQIFSTFCIGK